LNSALQHLGFEQTLSIDRIVELSIEVYDNFQQQVHAVEIVLEETGIVNSYEKQSETPQKEKGKEINRKSSILSSLDFGTNEVKRNESPTLDSLGMSSLSLNLLYAQEPDQKHNQSSPLQPPTKTILNSSLTHIAILDYFKLSIETKSIILLDYINKTIDEINDLWSEKTFFNKDLSFDFDELKEFCKFDEKRLKATMDVLVFLQKLGLENGIYQRRNCG
jgi:hypothetical protein